MKKAVNRRQFVKSSGGAVLGTGLLSSGSPISSESWVGVVTARQVQAGTTGDFDRFRKILVSPTINTPEPFQGFGGHTGWSVIRRLNNGDLFLAFDAGYYHGSWPTPIDMTRRHADQFRQRGYGWLLDWNAPDGGRIMWIRSRDQGKTWTRPKPFPIVRGAYYAAEVTQLRDGTLIAGARVESIHSGHWGEMPTTPLEFARTAANRMPQQLVLFRSTDNGDNWEEWSRITGPFLMMDAPYRILEAPDGALLLMAAGSPIPYGEGWPSREGRWVSLLMRSTDQGKSWSVRSIVGSNDFDVTEATPAFLPDGSLATPSRPTSAWWRSPDGGLTWEPPVQLFPGKGHEVDGPELYKRGDLLVTPEGLVVLVYCDYGSKDGSGQVIYSRDSGRTWIMPAGQSRHRGFRFDPLAYYPTACLLQDGSILSVGNHEPVPSRYGPFGAEVTAMRFRIKTPEEGEGIELLPIGE